LVLDPRLQPVARAIRKNEIVEAMRLLRAATGMGLKEARDVVDRLVAAGEGDLSSQLTYENALGQALAGIETGARAPVPTSDAELDDVVAELAASNRMYDAVKLVQAETGALLKPSTDRVHRVMKERGIEKKSAKGCFWAVAVIALILAASWYLGVAFK
jgi:hypothetical protein